ncbi:Uncharacterised protein [Chlamydia trachomatis]|nr:Uncharacterised protein [Chlamydia trachomatis]CRH47811.1 Uncharacterised protein [Chlamydia trachomatis]CRH55052.1 Uncharacterised protein [Chlamydia trachomatis]CRH55781.1 Uncharacterised protein [Chlamydia trachomatis]CRH57020.1 Uncharacterised protein [Chlamydia trachomatis]
METLKSNVEGKNHLNSLKDKINTKLNELFPNNELTKQGQANNHDLELTIIELASSVKSIKEEFETINKLANEYNALEIKVDRLLELLSQRDIYKKLKEKLEVKKDEAENYVKD